MTTPNPGSDEARKLGCRCAVLDNEYGRGFGDPPKFWISGDCPVHALLAAETVRSPA